MLRHIPLPHGGMTASPTVAQVARLQHGLLTAPVAALYKYLCKSFCNIFNIFAQKTWMAERQR